MIAHTETRTHPLTILLQIFGLMAMLVFGLIAFALLFKVAALVLGKLLPLLVIGAVIYVLVRLVTDAGK